MSKNTHSVHGSVIENGYTKHDAACPGTSRHRCTERDRTQDANRTDGLGTPAWNTGILGGAAGGLWGLGPLVPILLAMVESFFPPLPLIAIVALNVAAHGGLLGFLYSWAGVALGGIIMFLFWRRLIKRFFWKVASRSPKLEKAQQWVNRFDTSSLFMLSLLPFTPTSFMHFAFGMSDFDEKRYLRAVLLGKGLMVAMMAVFGQSLVSSLKNPVYLVLAVLLWGGMYWVSKRFCRKHHLE